MKKIKLWLVVWTIGLLGGILFCLLRLFGRVKTKGYRLRKFKPGNKGLVLISNHPSLWDPVLIPFLFFPWYLFFSNSIPFSTPDKKNYYQKSWFMFFRPVCVPIERGSRRKELATLEKLRKIIQQRKVLILFPEGGRTFKGSEFRFSSSGKKIRKFPVGIRRLFLNADCRILPVWIQGGEKIIPNRAGFPKGIEFLTAFFRLFYTRVTITIGEFRKPPREKKKIIAYLEDILLKLADCEI